MKKILFLLAVLIAFVSKAQQIKSIHLLDYNTNEDLMQLSGQIDSLAHKGINTIFLEIDYHFKFKSHPELQQTENVITKSGARKLANICSNYGISIIPQFQSLGHQSWAENTMKLLTVYPELDLTPGAFPNNDSLYCREWDLMNPKVNEIVFPMIDEIIDAFNAEGIHLGMDEVFLLGSSKSPSTKGMDPAFLYGKVVREFHDYFTKKQGKQLYMWGDRLIDASKYGYGNWEASMNGTFLAIDSVPKDIIICDWHYLTQNEYPSVDLFLKKGFRVLPSSWKDAEAANAFIRYSYAKQDSNMLGHMFTTWGEVPKDSLLEYGSMNKGLSTINENRFHEVFISQAGINKKGNLLVKLTAKNGAVQIAYSTDGSDPSPDSLIYNKPFEYVKGQVIKAVPVKNGTYAGVISEKEFIIHKGIGKRLDFITTPSDKYALEFKEQTLVNGIEFTNSYADGEWLGYEGNDVEFIIDLDSIQKINSVSINFNNKVNDWIHHPQKMIVLGSVDNKAFSVIGSLAKRKTGRPIVQFKVHTPAEVRFVKVIVANQIIPAGFNGEGRPAWIFMDEVIIR